MQKLTLTVLVSACLSTAAATPVLASDADAMLDMKERGGKIGAMLTALHDRHTGTPAAIVSPAIDGLEPLTMPESGGFVTIDVVADGDPQDVLRALEAMGLKNAAVFKQVISGAFPIDQLMELNAMTQVASVQPAIAIGNRGSVTSRGDIVQGSREARREEGVRGRGVTVGVLSNTYDCLGGAATDIATRDLPRQRRIDILDGGEDLPGACAPSSANDEGRAMMQLVHDVAPAARLAYHTALGGQAAFANGIIELQEAGADVIVDDIIYLAELMFQDGPIAQAVDEVVANGSAYFSSAGNNGRDSYESEFRASNTLGVFSGIRHDFDPGPGVETLQRITIEPFTSVTFVLQWDSPGIIAGGAPTDVEVDGIVYLDPAGTIPLLFLSGIDFNVSTDFIDGTDNPVEIFGFSYTGSTPLDLYLGVEWIVDAESTAAPGFIKYVNFLSPLANIPGAGNIDVEFATNSATSYGHANATGAAAVGAAAWFNTAAFNPGVCEPACLNSFSSAGGIPIFFDAAGNRLATPDLRPKPEFVGPDGGNTTFFGGDLGFEVPGTNEPDGFPNFFGTSASAPHVAGVAALMIEEEDDITPEGIYAVLAATAQDMNEPGFDSDTGAGFIDAAAAVELADDFDELFDDDDDDDDEDDDEDDDDEDDDDGDDDDD